MSGQFEPGAQLRQEELAERFGTSRIPVREALRQLEAEGMVVIHPNKGAVVSTLSVEEALEMLEIRIGLECRALKLAIPNMIDSDLEAARKILEDYDAEPKPHKWTEMNWRFHQAIYAPCSKPRLLSLIETNYRHLSRFTRVLVSMATGKERPQREHHALLNFAGRGNTTAAVALLEEHLVHTQKSIMAASRGNKAR